MDKNTINYTKEIMEKLLNTPSPTGYADDAINLVEEEFKKLDIKTYKTYKRALVATIPGQEDDAITFSGHVDTLGGMVKEIMSNGRIKFQKIGGYPYHTVERENVRVITQDKKEISGTILMNSSSVHCHPKDVESAERNEDSLTIVLDEEVYSDEDVKKLGIEIGDFIFIEPRVVITESGFIKSRHLDDKACVAAILAMAKEITQSGKKPNKTINMLISNYEEVGHGACVLPPNTKDLIAVDMAAPDPGQSSHETKVTICAMDSSGAYDIEVRRKLTELAKKENLDYVIDIYPFYGSDGSAALRAGNEIRVGLIGPGVANSHTYERTHIKGLENTIKLMLAYAFI